MDKDRVEYQVVVFKNGNRYKKSRVYVDYRSALAKYSKMKKEGGGKIFPVKNLHTDEVNFDIALIKRNIKEGDHRKTYRKDGMGRSVEIELESNNETIIYYSDNYDIEEKFYDYQDDKRITILTFYEKYFRKNNNFKNVFNLNNKVFINENGEYYCFTFKNVDESLRFIDVLRNYLNGKRKLGSVMITKTIYPAQKENLYEKLVEYGFNREYLYRTFTTYTKRLKGDN